MSDDSRKRSRFDQTEPDPPRNLKSRFDRRSRSPPRRSRSPGAVSSPSTVGGKSDAKDVESSSKSPAPVTDPKAAALAAAAAAARINAQLAEKTKNAPAGRPSAVVAKPLPKKDSSGIYQENGDYQKDIEINHLRNRYTLTKGAFQKMIKEQTGADVTTKGVYVPDSNTATITAPPLYLQITAQSKDALEKAVKLIEEEMEKDLPNLIDERRFRGRREQEDVERDEFGRRKWPEERIPIPLEPIPGFNLRAQVVGSQGSYVKYIQHETGCRVQIKGRGSGFIEHDTGRESDEQMYLHVSGRQKENVERAKELALELLQNVKKQYDLFKANGPNFGGRGGPRQNSVGAPGHASPSGSIPGTPSGGYAGYPQGGYGNSASPPPPPPPPGNAMSPQPSAQPDYSQQWQQYYAQQGQQDPNSDPYAAWGGQEAYMQYYAAYYAQMQSQAQVQSPAPVTENAGTPPGGYGYGAPPGSGSAPPPPPPPPPSDAGGYNAVPPPPGM
ncbi:uncharacterized protein PV09_03945 [Verruconis gallopava]|uniref:K Homology domain-containing protein n=1 Tax=Verruconis gallopava TaxID=253628 RepID=A0A0D2AG09_9PEZI|nr:uncharacterized protein PV09_03945 [Verruconis gallopava]KIW05435.1 hypothetical protein PV09_03945 [Verruconis gallopava]